LQCGAPSKGSIYRYFPLKNGTEIMKPEILRILAVEDNPADFRILQEYLREDSSTEYLVTLAGTLKEAMRLSSAEKFDVILLDLSSRQHRFSRA